MLRNCAEQADMKLLHNVSPESPMIQGFSFWHWIPASLLLHLFLLLSKVIHLYQDDSKS